MREEVTLEDLRELEQTMLDAKEAYQKKKSDENREAHRAATQEFADARQALRAEGLYANPLTDDELRRAVRIDPDSVTGKAKRG